MKRKRVRFFMICFCLSFALLLTGCMLKSNTPNESSSKGTWSDGNVDEGGWT